MVIVLPHLVSSKLLLVAKAEGFSAVEIPQTEIAHKEGLLSSHGTRAIANLCEKGFISKKRVGRKLIGYRECPNRGWQL